MGLAQHRIRRGVAEGLWQQQLPDSIAVHSSLPPRLSPCARCCGRYHQAADLYTEAGCTSLSIYCNLRSLPFQGPTITCRPIRQVISRWVP